MSTELAKSILKKSLAMHENEFSKIYIMPMLERMGYTKVEFHGGPNEGGKDIIAWRMDEADFVELTVVQVKKYQLSGAARNERSFSEIITQLQQAAEKHVANVDKQKYRPTKIYFITPYSLDTRALESRFEAYESLKSINIRVLDGPRLASLFTRHIHHLLHHFVDDQSSILNAIKTGLTNNELKKALNNKTEETQTDFYCDLDFSIGSISTRFFFNMQLPAKKIKLNIDCNDFEALIPLANKCKVVLGVDLITEDIVKLQNTLASIEADNGNKEKAVNDLQEKVAELNIEEIIFEIETSLADEIYDDIQSCAKRMLDARLKYKELERKDRSDYVRLNDIITKELRNIKELERYIDNNKLIELINYYISLTREKSRYEKQINKINVSIKPSVLQVSIDGVQLASKINERQEKLATTLNHLAKKVDIPALGNLIDEFDEVLRLTDHLLASEKISAAVGIASDQKYRDRQSETRTGLNILHVLDTGRDFVLYGEPGAGKTTTLQHYTKSKIETSIDKLTLYISLSKTVDAVNYHNVDEEKQLEMLLQLTAKYLQKLGAVLELNTLDKYLSDNIRTLIYDGLDEVYEKAPWVLGALKKLRKRYNKIQIIISSRLMAPCNAKLESLGLTLMPFTDEQRHRYFVAALGDNSAADRLQETLEGNPELNDIVRNPLNANMLCMLVKANVPIPHTEIKLYYERMRLLLGHYDDHKHVKRIDSDYYDLWTVLKKVAYHLHAREVRHDSIFEIISSVTAKLRDKVQPDKVALAVNELVYPCCVLEAMTTDGEIGFGHLRFQEFMVATEVNENRSINILDFLRREFWIGAFIMYSKMTDNLHSIISEIIENRSVSRYYDILKLMLKERPDQERQNLMSLVDANFELDKRDYYHRYL